MATKAVIQEQLKKERLLNRITHQLHDARDLDEILLYLKDEIIALFGAERITVYGVDTEKREIFLILSYQLVSILPGSGLTSRP